MRLNSHENNAKYSYLTNRKMFCVDTIFKMAAAVSLLSQIGLFGQNKGCSIMAWEKKHFTWFTRRDGFSPFVTKFCSSPLHYSGQNMVSS